MMFCQCGYTLHLSFQNKSSHTYKLFNVQWIKGSVVLLVNDIGTPLNFEQCTQVITSQPVICEDQRLVELMARMYMYEWLIHALPFLVVMSVYMYTPSNCYVGRDSCPIMMGVYMYWFMECSKLDRREQSTSNCAVGSDSCPIMGGLNNRSPGVQHQSTLILA